ncbi:RagB/SusD family nutrient uptake outer membrane protein [Ravibacter arvi]|uniref:RagB/SusD family nutrient uptake outer membrane protein n=1 Tax=Ravibacter arvi TaxID=2051041 RepID=A0ABP8LZS4_9BACT
MKFSKYKMCCYAALLAGMLVSCNEAMELPSDGRISMKDVFSDYNRIRGWVSSCYGYVPAPYMDRASFTDEAQDSDDNTAGSDYAAWYGGNVTAFNYAQISQDGSPWSGLYAGIRKCNIFLAEIPTATAYATEAEKKSWTAQVHALRALYYLQLIKRYGGVPVFDKPFELNTDFAAVKRATFSEVVKFILEDCDKALSFESGRDGFSWDVYENQFGIMTRAAAYAIKSEAITYAVSPLWSDGTFTMEQATQINAEALGQCLANDYRLFAIEPAANAAHNAYGLYFFTNSNDQRTNDKETILQVGSQMRVWQWAGLPSNTGMNRAGPTPTQDLVDAYEMANGQPPILGYSDANRTVPIVNTASGYDEKDPYTGRDPRFYASIYYNGSVRFLNQPNGQKVETFVGGREEISSSNPKNTRTGYYLRKFNNWQSGQNNEGDGAIRLFRLAELYLNFAETAYQSAGPDIAVSATGFSMTARQAVNAVRARAKMPALPAGLSKEAFEKRYRNERRIELAFETHRYFDVRRWKILNQTDEFVTGMRITKQGNNLTYTRFKFANRDCSSDRFLLYPIDPLEVNKMLSLTGANWQNPGWIE